MIWFGWYFGENCTVILIVLLSAFTLLEGFVLLTCKVVVTFSWHLCSILKWLLIICCVIVCCCVDRVFDVDGPSGLLLELKNHSLSVPNFKYVWNDFSSGSVFQRLQLVLQFNITLPNPLKFVLLKLTLLIIGVL